MDRFRDRIMHWIDQIRVRDLSQPRTWIFYLFNRRFIRIVGSVVNI